MEPHKRLLLHPLFCDLFCGSFGPKGAQLLRTTLETLAASHLHWRAGYPTRNPISFEQDNAQCLFTSDRPFPRNAAYLNCSPWLDQLPIQFPLKLTKLVSRHKFVNFGAETSLFSPDWSDQIDRDGEKTSQIGPPRERKAGPAQRRQPRLQPLARPVAHPGPRESNRRTFLKFACWLCDTNSSILERNKARLEVNPSLDQSSIQL